MQTCFALSAPPPPPFNYGAAMAMGVALYLISKHNKRSPIEQLEDDIYWSTNHHHKKQDDKQNAHK